MPETPQTPHAEVLWERRSLTSFLLAGLTFGAGLAFRHVRWLRILTWLGLISYSAYMLHPLVIEVYHHFAWSHRHYPSWQQVFLAGGLVVVLIAVCSLTYLFVERPMQDVGRRLAHWLDARLGLDRIPARAPSEAAILARRSQAVAE